MDHGEETEIDGGCTKFTKTNIRRYVAKCSLCKVWMMTIPSTSRRVSPPHARACFKDNERSTCLYCSSDKDNAGFQACGLTLAC